MTKLRGRMLDREEILSGQIAKLARRAARLRDIPIKSHEELKAVKHAVLAEKPPREDVWVFGYGSLMWNPAISFAEQRCGKVHGYHRRFAFWSTLGRGSYDNPGLMLGLSPGGSCNGVAFKIAEHDVETELHCIFLREMLSTAYHARWVPVRTSEGTVHAITFIANPEHHTYAGRVPEDVAAKHIATAEGDLGPCRDYLYNMVTHMAELGIRDTRMQDLMKLVQKHRAGLEDGS